MNNYNYIYRNGKVCLEHRVIWEEVYGPEA